MIRIEERTLIHAPVRRCFDLARSIELHLRSASASGETVVDDGGRTTGLLCLGDRVTWRARHLGLAFTLTVEIDRYDEPDYFRDVMIRGPFRFMRHDHFFLALSDGRTEMKDIFCFAAPFAIVSLAAERLLLKSHMREFLRKRNRVIKEIAESPQWRKYFSAAGSPTSSPETG